MRYVVCRSLVKNYVLIFLERVDLNPATAPPGGNNEKRVCPKTVGERRRKIFGANDSLII